MATISASAYNDSAARTAGEAITITAGAVWTVRTDYRVHANAPASNLGSLAAVTVTEGRFEWDSRNVRWMPFTNSGSAVVPAIGTSISQGGVSGYLLGIWASKTTAQTAVGAAIPASGFMKFREVTGGSFAAGAITGIANISASGPDVQGWISLPHDTAVDLTVPRLGEFRARGDRFFLENTNGSIGQIFQIPTDGSAAMMAPGLWIETDVADTYEYWPSLFGSTNGWHHSHIGEAAGITDARQNYVKAIAGGQMQMGESVSQASTYISLAAQSSTHAEISHSCTYIWEDDLVTVYFATGHLLETGMQTGLDFTSGGATASDGIFTVTVLSPYHFTVPLAGSGLGGAVTSKPGITISMATHALNIGEQVYCDFTTGTPVDGTYTIYAVPATGTYNIAYPHVAALTSGAVSVLHTLTITFTAHGLAVGNKVYLDFTSGAGVDGYYTVKTVVDANNYRVNMPHSAAITTSNVTMQRTIGNVAPAGRKTWIGSNILNEVATGARATNTVPAAAAASRPEWITTSAGYIDLEYVYGCSGYPSFGQAYNVRLHNCAFFDALTISECASPLDVVNTNLSMYGALDVVALTLTSNFAGGVFGGKFMRGNTPNTNDHAANISYCKGINFSGLQSAIVQFARSTGVPLTMSYCSNMSFSGGRILNGNIALTASVGITFDGVDYCDRLNGRTNATTPYYSFLLGAGCSDIKIDGITFGVGNTLEDCHPYTGLVSYSACARVKVRNIGSRAVPLSGGTWATNAYGIGTLLVTGGNNDNIKNQRIYYDKVRSAPFTNVNSDKNMLYESVFAGRHVWGTKAILGLHHADLNGYYKGVQEINGVTGQGSVYGTHFVDLFMGDGRGRILLPFNEPTPETSAVFEMNSGTAKFNSAGGLLLTAVGMQATFTDLFTRYGHTAFERTEALLSGPTQTRFDLHYAIDTGSGFGPFHNLYYTRAGGTGTSGQFTFTVTDATGIEVGDYVWGTGIGLLARVTNISSNTITVNVANSATVSGVIRFNHLPFESISPSTGFKLKFRVTVITTETIACAYLRVDTISTAAAQAGTLYPLDVTPFTFEVLDSALAPLSGYEYRIYTKDPTPGVIGTEIAGVELYNSASYTFNHEYSSNTDIVVQIIKEGYEESTTEYTINATSQTVKIILQTEYNI
jgi:hypothetical protein